MALDQARGNTVDAEPRLGRRGDPLRTHRAAVTALLLYLAVSCWLFWPLVRHLRSAQIGGPDTSLFSWWLGWTPYAISHGHSPFLSSWLNAPVGVNGMWNISVPLLGVLFWPVTATAGPVASVNLLMILSPALSAWAAFLAARMLGLRAASALLAGFLYGFAAYTLAQAESGHLHLALAVFPPLVAALLHRLLTGVTSPRKAGLLLGVGAVLQVLVGEEILATAGIVTVLVLAYHAVRMPAAVPQAATRLATAAGWALLVAVPLSAPALLVQFFGRGHLTSGVPMTPWSTDLLAAITPTPQSKVSDLLSQHAMTVVQMGNFDEITGYVGIPALLLLLLSGRRLRRTGLGWCWTGLVVSWVLAIGWSVRVAGHDTGIDGPAQLMAQLPVLQNIVTVRFSLYVVLFVSLLAGAAWDSARAAAPGVQHWTTALVALSVVAVLPQQPHRFTRFTDPAAFTSGRLLPGVPDGATVAMLPWPNAADASAMRWQAVGGFHYKLMGMWGVVAGAHGEGNYGAPTPQLNTVARQLALTSQPPPPPGGEVEQRVMADLADLRTKAQALVVGPVGDSARVARYLTGLLQELPTVTGGVYVFRLTPG
jgi:hypothetical protein